jgi:VanZ family protein
MSGNVVRLGNSGDRVFGLQRIRARDDKASVQNPLSASRRAWVWPFAIAALIFVASSQSKLAGPSLPGIDKVTHFLVYGLLATYVIRLGPSLRGAWCSLAIVSVYGLLDEWHQSFTPGRSVEIADWVADTLGAAVAILLYLRWSRYRDWLEMPLWRKRRIEKGSAVGKVLVP